MVNHPDYDLISNVDDIAMIQSDHIINVDPVFLPVATLVFVVSIL